METSTDRINRRAAISAMPRVRFVCGRDWLRGPDAFHVGVFWDRDFDATPAQICYARWFTIVLRIKFRLLIDRSRWEP